MKASACCFRRSVPLPLWPDRRLSLSPGVFCRVRFPAERAPRVGTAAGRTFPRPLLASILPSRSHPLRSSKASP